VSKGLNDREGGEEAAGEEVMTMGLYGVDGVR